MAMAMILTLNIAKFIEDSEPNLMLAINLDECRNLDRWARRTNLVRKIVLEGLLPGAEQVGWLRR